MEQRPDSRIRPPVVDRSVSAYGCTQLSAGTQATEGGRGPIDKTAPLVYRDAPRGRSADGATLNTFGREQKQAAQLEFQPHSDRDHRERAAASTDGDVGEGGDLCESA